MEKANPPKTKTLASFFPFLLSMVKVYLHFFFSFQKERRKIERVKDSRVHRVFLSGMKLKLIWEMIFQRKNPGKRKFFIFELSFRAEM